MLPTIKKMRFQVAVCAAGVLVLAGCARFGRQFELFTDDSLEATIGLPVDIQVKARVDDGSIENPTNVQLSACTTAADFVPESSIFGLSLLNSNGRRIVGRPTVVGPVCLRIYAEVYWLSKRPHDSSIQDFTVQVHPKLTALSPSSQTSQASGGGPFTLTVTGEGFESSATSQPIVLFNGAGRATRLVSATQLEADILATDLANPGIVQVSVDNGPPRGGIANVVVNGVVTGTSLPFTVSGAPPVLTITTASLPNGFVGQQFNATLQATGGVSPYSWRDTSGGFGANGQGAAGTPCQGLTLNVTATGLNTMITGTPANAGTCNLTVQIQDSANPRLTASKPLSVIVGAGAGPLAITNATLPNGVEDTNYNATVQTTGGVFPLNFAISAGALPQNVSLNASSGALTGLRPAGGVHSFTVRVQDSGNPQQTVTQAYSLRILEVTTPSLPNGFVGQPYALTFAAIGQVSPITWRASAGSTLPNGFAVSLAGILSGIPTTTGQFFFCVEVTDGDMPQRTDERCYSVTFNNPVPAVATLTPATAASGSAAFTLRLDGTGFIPASEVRWNGVARTTTFVSYSRLTADIPAADLVAVGTANVTVFNPGPVGGLSNAATFSIALPPAPGSSAGVTDLVSQSSAGIPGNAGSAISGGGPLIGISRNGNRVVFASEATNLDGPERGVFVRDMALGATRRVSRTILNATETAVVGESVSISADGLVVAFQSRSNNHVAGDTGNDADIFVVNTCIEPPGTPPVDCLPPEWISVMPDGSEPLFGSSASPSLSATGRFVAFGSNSPLTGINAGSQIYLRDRQSNVTTLVSVNDDGNAGVGFSGNPAISADGRFVAFVSSAPNLVANDTNNSFDVFVRDTCFGASGLCTPGTTRVSVATGGAQVVNGASDFYRPSISDNGRFVVFTSSASTLVPNDTNNITDVFIHDRLAVPVPTTTRISLNTTGAQFFGANGGVSDDGRLVAFDASQAFVYDTCFGAPAGCTQGSFVVSRVIGGASASIGGQQSAISGDGCYVAFQSQATNLLPGITTGLSHIYRARTN